MRINSPVFIIFALLVTFSMALSACVPSAAPTSIPTEVQPVQPTDTQIPPLTNTIPPPSTDTLAPPPTDTQSGPPSVTQAQPTSTEAQPAISGAALLDSRCTACHSKSRVTGTHKSPSGWEQTVQRMVFKGAQLTPEELMILVEYLAQNY